VLLCVGRSGNEEATASVSERDVGEEILVWHKNLSEPGQWYGELGGIEMSRTKMLDGNWGDHS
jgi:hypothetical protein